MPSCESHVCTDIQREVELVGLLLRYPSCRAILEPQEYEPGLQELCFQAERTYAKKFGNKPDIYAKGSTRVEFFGNFTDQGVNLHALGFPTNLGIVAAVGERKDRIIKISSSIMNDEKPIEIDLDHLPGDLDTGHWSNYEKSILKQLKNYLDPHVFSNLKGVNICLVANVPPGSAISTSAAVEASFIHGFLGMNGISLSERTLVHLTKKAENSIGSGCGILDQATSNTAVSQGYGVLLHFADQNDGVPYEAKKVYMDIERYGAQIAIVLPRKFERNLAKTDYNHKAQLIQKGSRCLAQLLNKEVDTLTTSDVTDNYRQLAASSDIDGEEMAKTVLHAISDNERVLTAAGYLNSLHTVPPYSPEATQILHKLGAIMEECARSSIDHYGVSTGVKGLRFDQIIDAMKQGDAIGGRNEGGGGSPTSIALVQKKNMPFFIKEFPKRMKKQFPDLDFYVLPVSLGKPSRVLHM